MPRKTVHGLTVPTHGEALRALDRQIFALGVEGLAKLDAGGGLAEIDSLIGFMKHLLQRRDTVLRETKREARQLGTNPGKLYREAREDVDQGMETEERNHAQTAG